ncbi:STAS domain-containing protein [Roseomonas sp. E05]|uniref:STAS domain-containing protein n=1 Tax=Roseomonas sp. E05 TaxID=3046310 RepID=UPI0024BBBC0E|nr:STAS domain-containing protein [Roseomonas sp. E05]MDJ0391607.1 STAS domain-containing protein [Roseomonas sp. E05]
MAAPSPCVHAIHAAPASLLRRIWTISDQRRTMETRRRSILQAEQSLTRQSRERSGEGALPFTRKCRRRRCAHTRKIHPCNLSFTRATKRRRKANMEKDGQEPSAEDHCLVLSGALLLREAEDLHARLLHAVQVQPRLELDLAAVTEADLSALQLLLAAGRSAKRSGKPVQVRGVLPASLREALARAGFPDPAGENAAQFSCWMQSETAA